MLQFSKLTMTHFSPLSSLIDPLTRPFFIRFLWIAKVRRRATTTAAMKRIRQQQKIVYTDHLCKLQFFFFQIQGWLDVTPWSAAKQRGGQFCVELATLTCESTITNLSLCVSLWQDHGKDDALMDLASMRKKSFSFMKQNCAWKWATESDEWDQQAQICTTQTRTNPVHFCFDLFIHITAVWAHKKVRA